MAILKIGDKVSVRDLNQENHSIGMISLIIISMKQKLD